ncbi:MAG: sensor histidine kinase [Thermodesulfobacteriota bacterium]
MRRGRIFHIPFLLVLALFYNGSVSLAAVPPLELTPTRSHQPLGGHLELLVDAPARLTLEEVRAPGIAGGFHATSTAIPSLGFTSAAVWCRFTLKNSLPEPMEYFLEVEYPLLDSLSLYVPTDGITEKLEAGDLLPFKVRSIPYRNVIFPLKLEAGAEKTFHLRCQTSSSMNIPLSIHTAAGMAGKIGTEQILFGIYFGILLVIILYNLFIFAGFRDTTYLVYVFFVGSYLLFQLGLNGMAFQYLWPEHTWWANTSIPLAIFLAYGFGTLFTRMILDTKRHVPRLDIVLKCTTMLATLGAIASPMMQYAVSIRLATLLVLTVPVLILSGFICMRKGYRPARYYFSAWTVSLAGMGVYALKTFGALPHNAITHWGIQFSSAWEVILLSMGLADRFYLIKKEKEHLQAEYAHQMALSHGKLETAYHELEKFKDSLENAVKERTAELAEANVELTRHNQLKTAFISNVSHELRTPLTSIRGFAKLIRKDFSKYFRQDAAGKGLTAKAERIDQNLQIIELEGERLTRLVNDLLDFAKIESGRMTWQEEEIDVAALLGHAMSLAQGDFVTRPNVALRLEVPPELPVITGDRDRLVQVLVNLLNNAAKFTQQGEVVLAASMSPEQNALLVQVRDSGSGIPPDDLDKIFDQFHQASNRDTLTDKPKGTGLGLAICRQIVEHHGGRIWAESRPGAGSILSFTLPLPAVVDRR